MATLQIELDESTLQKVRQLAKRYHNDVSTFISSLLQKELERSIWSEETKALVGSWGDDFPSIEEIRSSQTSDTSRETF